MAIMVLDPEERAYPRPVHVTNGTHPWDGKSECGHRPPDRFTVSSDQDAAALSCEACRNVLIEKQRQADEAAKDRPPKMVLTFVADPNRPD